MGTPPLAGGEPVVAADFVSPNLLFLMFSFGCHDRAMSSDAKIDYQREAMAAMRMAVASDGFERLKWVRVAQAWQDLGRERDVRTDNDNPSSMMRTVSAQRD